MANQFLPFCSTNTGTNLPTQGDYAADPNRSIGASPGVASSKLNNKPLRQATVITSQIAEYISQKTSTDTLDDANLERLLSQINATFLPIAPLYTKYLSGSGNFSIIYYLFCALSSANIGATYTHDGKTFTVTETVSSGSILKVTGTGAPLSSGTLTRSTGTGDNTIIFYAMRAPTYLDITIIGGGGGGGGSGVSATGGAGGAGGTTTFGTSLLTALGGGTGQGSGGSGGIGGSYTINSPAIGDGVEGGGGGASTGQQSLGFTPGGIGGNSYRGGAGGTALNGAGRAGSPNSGSGGGAGSSGSTAVNTAGGGGAGGFIKAMIANPLYSYSYSVGIGGTAGTAGTNGFAGGAGGSGFIGITAFY